MKTPSSIDSYYLDSGDGAMSHIMSLRRDMSAVYQTESQCIVMQTSTPVQNFYGFKAEEITQSMIDAKGGPSPSAFLEIAKGFDPSVSDIAVLASDGSLVTYKEYLASPGSYEADWVGADKFYIISNDCTAKDIAGRISALKLQRPTFAPTAIVQVPTPHIDKSTPLIPASWYPCLCGAGVLAAVVLGVIIYKEITYDPTQGL